MLLTVAIEEFEAGNRTRPVLVRRSLAKHPTGMMIGRTEQYLGGIYDKPSRGTYLP